MKKVLGLTALLGVVFTVAGCNTVAGVRQDVKATCQGVENAAKNVQKKL